MEWYWYLLGVVSYLAGVGAMFSYCTNTSRDCLASNDDEMTLLCTAFWPLALPAMLGAYIVESINEN